MSTTNMPSTGTPNTPSWGSVLLGQLGGGIAGAASGVLGGLTGMLFQGEQDQNQINQAQKLAQVQLQANEQLSSYNYGQQLQFWNETNAPAQVAQYNAAGLNPALMYAKGGPGGSTGTPTTGISGQAAPNANPVGMGIQAGMQNQLNLAQQKAQIDLTEAQAAKVQADTPSGGAGTLGNATLQNIQTSTQSLAAGTENTQANTAMTKIQTQLEQFKANIANVTQDDQIKIIKDTANIIDQQMQSQEVQTTIDKATQGDRIATIYYNMMNDWLTGNKIVADTGVANTISKYAGAYAGATKVQAGAAASQANTAALQQGLNATVHNLDDATRIKIESALNALGITVGALVKFAK